MISVFKKYSQHYKHKLCDWPQWGKRTRRSFKIIYDYNIILCCTLFCILLELVLLSFTVQNFSEIERMSTVVI